MDAEQQAYKPMPVDTAHVSLPDGIEELTETLARNTHEVWAQQRLRDGWHYGPARNDELRQHPSLVPYDQLSESEKTYDRDTALETIRLIIALGYRIEKAER